MDRHKNRYSLFFFLTSVWLLLMISTHTYADIERVKYQAQGNYLIVEVLDDDLIHFEYGVGTGPESDTPIVTSDIICSDTERFPKEKMSA